MKKLEIMGRKFGFLTPVNELASIDGVRWWRLRCDCGNEIDRAQKTFTSGGKSTSCGCMNVHKQKNHGQSKRPEYKHWINMKSRCANPTTPYFERYGGRGVKVCPQWIDDFERFLADVGPKPGAGYSIDRIDLDGDYEPSNVRWANQKTQARNTSFNRVVEIDGKVMTLAEAVETSPVCYNTVMYRLKRGWPVEKALSAKLQRGVNGKG